MPVTQILLLRHGHRMGWSLDPTTGTYSSSHRFPTNLAADPPLAAHGVRQSHETATYLSETLEPFARRGVLRLYSSLFYRCLETLRPTVESLRRQADEGLQVRGELGVGEWFGKAWFDQPVPASVADLKEKFFPFLDLAYKSLVTPERKGERIQEVHRRVAVALEAVVADVEREFERLGRGGEEVVLLICGHAAQIICAGRALTGQVPDDLDTEDFKCFTCGISKFVRRDRGRDVGGKDWRGESGGENGDGEWKDGQGVAGGWDCVLNSWCGHLSQGEERGWHFHGDESFDSYGPGSGPQGIVVEAGTVGDDDNDDNGQQVGESKNGNTDGGGVSKL